MAGELIGSAMKRLKFSGFLMFCAVTSALSGCFVSAGGTTPLDAGNPHGPQVGTEVTYDVSNGTVSPSVSIGAGPITLGF